MKKQWCRAGFLTVLIIMISASCDQGSRQEKPSSVSRSPALVKKAADTVTLDGEKLGLKGPELIKKVSALLSGADRLLQNQAPPDPLALQKYLEQNIVESNSDVTFKKDPETLSKEAGRIIDNREKFGLDAESLLRAAADMWLQEHEEANSFDAKREVLELLRTFFPSQQARMFRFHADPGLVTPEGMAACASASPKYVFGGKAPYFEDALYISLYNLPDKDLPGDAIAAVVRLLTVQLALNQYVYDGMMPENLADKFLVRYGRRALPCLWEAMRDPAGFAKDAGGTVAALRRQALYVGQKLPPLVSMPLFTAAAIAGWNDWYDDMPREPLFDTIRTGYSDIREVFAPVHPNNWNPYRP